MSNLTNNEKIKLEKFFDMGGGYVLGFSNRTFRSFFFDTIDKDIYDVKYSYQGESKANRLRAFWKQEPDDVVGKSIITLLDYWKTQKFVNNSTITPLEQSYYDECKNISDRLLDNAGKERISPIKANSSEKETPIATVESIPKRSSRQLKVFLCHARADATRVHALYTRLVKDGIDAWLDKENLLPGQEWELVIRRAVRETDLVIVCLSKQFNQAGFRQKEVKLALDTAMEKTEGEIFIIPARLEECDTLESLRRWHWVNLFEHDGYKKLTQALSLCAEKTNATFGSKTNSKSAVTKFKERHLVGEVGILVNLGSAHLKMGDYSEARDYFEQSLNLSRELGDRKTEISVLTNLAYTYDSIGDLVRATELYERALLLSNELGIKQ